MTERERERGVKCRADRKIERWADEVTEEWREREGKRERERDERADRRMANDVVRDAQGSSIARLTSETQ